MSSKGLLRKRSDDGSDAKWMTVFDSFCYDAEAFSHHAQK